MPRFPKPGTVLLGKYRVHSLIGEGGMGAVLKARHIELEEDVAIKCLLPEMMSRDDIVRRFLREAKAAVKLKGEHVARVIDVGKLDNEVPFIVMEFLDGADLNAILKHHGAQDPAIAVDLLLQACEAIAEAHSIGIIHRDIKASNFFISQPENQAPHLKVLDFGIATAPEGASDLTSTQSVIGTPAYMAPEQMRSSKIADARSDIWSMGVVLFELLEGERPFRSEVYSDLCLKVGMDPPAPIENPNVPEALVAVVMKCLEKPIERRYQSVAELAFDLMPFASDPVFARATVEQCARLLGRRAMKMFEAAAAGAERDVTPMPRVPQRPTPASMQYAAANPNEISDVLAKLTPAPPTPSNASPSLLGRPTPLPSKEPKTPTSIQSSVGQVSHPSDLSPRGRGAFLALVTCAVLAIAGTAAWKFGFSGGANENPEPPKVGPATRPEEVKPAIDTPNIAPDDDSKPASTIGETAPTNDPHAKDDTKPVPTIGTTDDTKTVPTTTAATKDPGSKHDTKTVPTVDDDAKTAPAKTGPTKTVSTTTPKQDVKVAKTDDDKPDDAATKTVKPGTKQVKTGSKTGPKDDKWLPPLGSGKVSPNDSEMYKKRE